MLQEIKISIPSFLNAMTVKEFLKYFHVGRGKIEEIRVGKQIFIQGEQRSLQDFLKPGDELKIISQEKDVFAYPSSVEVLYEDDGLIAVNKPRDLLIHSDGNEQNTLLSQVAYYRKKKGELPIVYPLHRLDKDTTGVVLFAKDFFHGAMMDSLFEQRKILREYRLLVLGAVEKNEGTLSFKMARDRHNAQKRIVHPSGVETITHYKVLKRSKEKSLLSVQIDTGKRHQIRVGFQHFGHPILGDKIYGSSKEEGNLMLQAVSLTFIHPLTKEKIQIHAPILKELKK